MSCMHAKFDHEETCIDLYTMQHMLYSKLPSDRWDYVLFVTIFILVIMNAYTHTFLKYVSIQFHVHTCIDHIAMICVIN